METYLLKASAILLLFLLTYRVLLRNETFFNLNRAFLLSGLLASLLLPLVRLRQEVLLPVTLADAGTLQDFLPQPQEQALPWDSLLWGAYLTGAGYFLFRMLTELLPLLRLMKDPQAQREEGFTLVPCHLYGAPFSFFKYIFYDPRYHKDTELVQILEHEKAHGRQLHSLDILLGRAVAILLWANPMAWRYLQYIHQNLEYLADAQAVRHLPSVKHYQYTLLKVSGNPVKAGLVNPFTNSFIKKRIVMLQQNQSKTIHLLKYLLILPVLGLFLMAFNRETVYVPQGPSPQELYADADNTIEVVIDRNTTEAQLLEMKENFKKDDIDFSYTAVRNDAGEIIDLSFDFKGKAKNGNPFSGAYSCECDGPIKPITIQITDSGGVYFGEVEARKELQQGQEFHFDNTSGNTMVWVQKSDDAEDERIEIRHVDGKEVIIVDGKQVTREELGKDGDAKKIFVRMLEVGDDPDVDVKIHKIEVDGDGDHESIMILGPDSDGNYTGSKQIEVRVDGDGPSTGEMIFIDTAGDKGNVDWSGSKALFIIDGKEANRKKASALDPDEIETIHVWKGDKAVEKYGKKAKDGVVEITTRKQ